MSRSRGTVKECDATKRKAHKACQIKVLLILTHVWQDYLPSILAKFKATHYDDPDRREGDNPYCVATACYAAIQSYCKPRDSTTRNNNRALFEAALFNFPQYHGDLKPIETWASTAAMRWLDLSPHDANLQGAEQSIIQRLFHTLKAASMSDIADKISWKDFESWLNNNNEWRDHSDLTCWAGSLVRSPPRVPDGYGARTWRVR